jgi:hypothetical protein
MATAATAAPTASKAIDARTDEGAMPANESENMRATVTAGLAKLVEDVKK